MLAQADPSLLTMQMVDGCTPIHVAVGTNNIQGVKHLLSIGANINELKRDGESVLHIALKSANFSEEMFQFLLEQGCSILAKDNFGTNALHLACRMKKLSIVKLILNKNTNTNNNTIEGNIDIVELVDNDGLTPLHALCGSSKETNDVEILRELLNAGAKLCVGDHIGATPLHYAVSKAKNTELVKEILSIV